MAYIRITGNKENKLKGFGILLDNFGFSSNAKDEYVVVDRAIDYLVLQEIEFDVL